MKIQESVEKPQKKVQIKTEQTKEKPKKVKQNSKCCEID